jgi:hypothetical protein
MVLVAIHTTKGFNITSRTKCVLPIKKAKEGRTLNSRRYNQYKRLLAEVSR